MRRARQFGVSSKHNYLIKVMDLQIPIAYYGSTRAVCSMYDLDHNMMPSCIKGG